MRYDVVLFDFDGTIADTWACGLDIYNGIARQHRFRPVTDPSAARRLSTVQFLRDHRVPLLRLPFLVREFQHRLRERMHQVSVFPGIVELLSALKAAGVRSSILSSNTIENITIFLEAHRLAGAFASVESYPKLLGKSRGIRRYIKATSTTPSRLLYVGDEIRDLDAAWGAGVDVAAVSWGLNPPDVLLEHAPNFLVAHPSELLEVLRRPGTPTPALGANR